MLTNKAKLLKSLFIKGKITDLQKKIQKSDLNHRILSDYKGLKKQKILKFQRSDVFNFYDSQIGIFGLFWKYFNLSLSWITTYLIILEILSEIDFESS